MNLETLKAGGGGAVGLLGLIVLRVKRLGLRWDLASGRLGFTASSGLGCRV